MVTHLSAAVHTSRKSELGQFTRLVKSAASDLVTCHGKPMRREVIYVCQVTGVRQRRLLLAESVRGSFGTDDAQSGHS